MMPHIFPRSRTSIDITINDHSHWWPFQKLYSNWRIILKTVLVSLCFTCFVIQTWNVTYQYIQRDTMITTWLKKPSYLTLPAITFCAPVLIPFRKLCHLNESDPQCKTRMENSVNLTENIYVSEESRWNLIRAHHEDKIVTEIAFKRLFENISSNEIINIPLCRIAKTSLQTDMTSKWTECSQNETSHKIESIIYNSKMSKSGEYCQTFFSKLDPNYNETNMIISLREFGNVMSWFAVQVKNLKWFHSNLSTSSSNANIGVSVHPNNVLPSDIESKFMKISPFKTYQIEYSRLVSTLLEPPFKTNCSKYKSGPNKSISQSDCVRKCIFLQAWNEEKKCRRQWNVIVIGELNENEMLCPRNIAQDNDYLIARNECESNCQPDCFQEDFDSRIEIMEDHYIFRHPDSDYNQISGMAEVKLRHHTKADIIIVHTQEMSFSGYVANVGGLAGIYLGISIITFCEFLFGGISKLGCFKKKENINNRIEMR